jgi:hypothetical protein
MIGNWRKLLRELKHSNIIILGFLALFLPSCDLASLSSDKGDQSQGEVVAKVRDKYLFKEDLANLVPKGASLSDSASITERYVKSWVKKQLLISEASNQLVIDEAALERKVLDYRYALMIYEFEKLYINEKLDRDVSEEEIKKYYKENNRNFELKQNIIKGLFVKLPKEAPKLKRFKKLLKPSDEEELEELRSYCYRFAASYSLEDTVWINFDDIVRNTPLMNIPNKVQFLKDKNNSFVEVSDDNYLYFLVIKEYKITDQISPLEFVRENIKDIIINKRKIQLTKKLEEEIYNRAAKNNDFEIYPRKP